MSRITWLRGFHIWGSVPDMQHTATERVGKCACSARGPALDLDQLRGVDGLVVRHHEPATQRKLRLADRRGAARGRRSRVTVDALMSDPTVVGVA